MRDDYFFKPKNTKDTHTWTLHHSDHRYFVLWGAARIVRYAHVQLWPKQRAALRMIVIDESCRNRSLGGKFLALCEEWLKKKGYLNLHTESSPTVIGFYRKNGYVDMPFNDPDGHESDALNIPVGKLLLE